MIEFTITQYAEKYGISRAAVYKKMQTVLAPFVIQAGKKTVLSFPDEETAAGCARQERNRNCNRNRNRNRHYEKVTPEVTFEVTPEVTRENAEEEGKTDETVTDENVTENVTVTKENATVTDKNVTVTNKNVTVTDENVTMLLSEITSLKQRLQDKDAHIATLTETVEKLRSDLDAERAAHAADRDRDAKALDQAQQLQAQANALLHQEQTKHKPFRLLLAEKASSLFRKAGKDDSGASDPEWS